MRDSKLNIVTEHTAPEGIKCSTFGASSFEERHLATGDYKGNLSIWDVEDMDEPVYSVQAHSSLINCIDGISSLTTL